MVYVIRLREQGSLWLHGLQIKPLPLHLDMSVDAISLSLFANRVAAICEEMGAVLRRSSFSPNIRERLDYSCAIFGVIPLNVGGLTKRGLEKWSLRHSLARSRFV